MVRNEGFALLPHQTDGTLHRPNATKIIVTAIGCHLLFFAMLLIPTFGPIKQPGSASLKVVSVQQPPQATQHANTASVPAKPVPTHAMATVHPRHQTHKPGHSIQSSQPQGTPQSQELPALNRRSMLLGLAALDAISSPWGGSAYADDSIPLELPSESEFLQAVMAQSSATTQTTFSKKFGIYLAGFLVNYDDKFRVWWRKQVRNVPEYFRPSYRMDVAQRQSYVKLKFRELVLEVQSKVSKLTSKELVAILVSKYNVTGGTVPGARHQLILLLSFLDTDRQPRALIANLIKQEFEFQGKELNTTQIFTLFERNTVTPDTGIVALLSGFYTPRLLPEDLYPLYDQSDECWVVPRPPPQPADASNPFPFYTGDLLGDQREDEQQFKLGFNWVTIVVLAFCGSSAASFTNFVTMPLEMIKTRQQSSSGPYKESIGASLATIVAKDNQKDLLLAATMTALGYAFYGTLLFPGFELGKLWLSGKVGITAATEYRLPLVIFASAVTTVFACWVKVPFETAKIRIIANPGTAESIPKIFRGIVKDEGPGALFEGYPPLVSRNVLYNSAKFFVFDYFVDVIIALYPNFPTDEFTLSLTKGWVAGIFASMISNPADVILTKVAANPEASVVSAVGQIVEEDGPSGFFKGVVVRCLLTGIALSIQFVIYDTLKEQLFGRILDGYR